MQHPCARVLKKSVQGHSIGPCIGQWLWGLLPFSCLAFFSANLAPHAKGHGPCCQDCTLSQRESKEAGRLSSAQPLLHHLRSHLELSETHGEAPPTIGYRVLHVQVPPLEIPWRWRDLDPFQPSFLSGCREFASRKCLI